jgi:hypothetical protein
MKKIIFALVVTFVVAASFTACTDENVKPQTNEGGAMGDIIDPKGK